MSRPRTTTVAVVTGTRAEFGLLRPVIAAIEAHASLRARVVVAGTHLLPPAHTGRQVAAEFPVAARVPMQRDPDRPRADDALAVGRGVTGFARCFARLGPDVVLVLGDRVEAFAAAAAASVAGIAVAHAHGGDRAEGIADEAMRHAITKLAHLHLPASKRSARRIVRMGEPHDRVILVGSPAVDGLAGLPPLPDALAATLGDPAAVLLMHPAGLPPAAEAAWADAAIALALRVTTGAVLALDPNHDPGRSHVLSRLDAAAASNPRLRRCHHLPRDRFVALLKRLALASPRGCIVGNSSAALIESAAIGLPALNLGPRQAGREHGPNVAHAPDLPTSPRRLAELARQFAALLKSPRARASSRFGDGNAAARIAEALARLDTADPTLLRKRNSY